MWSFGKLGSTFFLRGAMMIFCGLSPDSELYFPNNNLFCIPNQHKGSGAHNERNFSVDVHTRSRSTTGWVKYLHRFSTSSFDVKSDNATFYLFFIIVVIVKKERQWSSGRYDRERVLLPRGRMFSDCTDLSGFPNSDARLPVPFEHVYGRHCESE